VAGAVAAQAAVVHVRPWPAGLRDGSSWANACGDLQAAIEAAAALATPEEPAQVWVAAGTYRPNSWPNGGGALGQRHFSLRNQVAVYGGFPATGNPTMAQRDHAVHVTRLSGDTDVDGRPSGNCIHVFHHPAGTDLDASAILDGATIADGNAWVTPFERSGAGMLNDSSSPTLRNCLFTRNIVFDDGGALCNNGSAAPTLLNCVFVGNEATYGGALCNNGSAAPTLANCTFTGNQATYGGAVCNAESAAPILANCVFVGNEASHGGALYNTLSSPVLANCILWSNRAYEGTQVWNAPGAWPPITYSCVADGYEGTGNIATDPRFADTASGLLHLLPDSPCVDAGNTAAVPPEATTDVTGAPRVQGAAVDMGAYERTPTAPGMVAIAYRVHGLDAARVTVGAQTGRWFEIEVARGGAAPPVTASGGYLLRWTGPRGERRTDNPLALPGVDSDQVWTAVVSPALPEPNGVVYVRPGGTGDGSSWARALGDLQAAIETAALFGDGQVWVAAGTYTPSSWPNGGTAARERHFSLRNHAAVLGGFPANGEPTLTERDPAAHATVLSGDLGVAGSTADNAYHVFYHPKLASLDTTATLAGVTVTAGHADGPWADLQASGAGMLNELSSPMLRDCAFSANSAGCAVLNWCSSPVLTHCTFSANLDGGGMYSELGSSPVLTDCTFTGNAAYSGGGVHQGGGALTLTDSTFTRNSGRALYIVDSLGTVLSQCRFVGNSGGEGGALYCENSSPALAGCTFSANVATYGGGIYNVDRSSPTLSGCTLSCNSAASGGGIYNSSGSYGGGPSGLTLTECTFTDNIADDGNNSACGGGIYNSNCDAVVTDCVFSRNRADYGGGICNTASSGSVLRNCIFDRNDATESGGALRNTDHSTPSLINCVLAGNSANHGGGVCNDGLSRPALTNCTLAGNRAYLSGGTLHNTHCAPTLTNCILWGNLAPEAPEVWNESRAHPVVTYSCVAGGYAGEGNLDADPRFPDLANGVVSLLPGSPCIDTGRNAALPPEVTTDVAGLPRIQGLAVDLGAYERTPIPAGRVAVGFRVEGTATARLDDGAQTERWFEVELPMGTAAPPVSVRGGYLVRWTGSQGEVRTDNPLVVTGATTDQVWTARVASAQPAPGTVVHVRPEGTGNGSSWAEAVGDLQVAIEAAALFGGGQVWVAAGTYTPTSWPNGGAAARARHFSLRNLVTVYGGFPASGNPTLADRDPVLYQTILSGDLGVPGDRADDSYHVVYHPGYVALDASAVLDAVTITGGQADGEGSRQHGGGMYNCRSAPALAGCRITGNAAAEEGGGLYNSFAAPVLTGCALHGNQARYGAGLYNDSSAPLLDRCTFEANEASASGGAACNLSSAPQFDGCRFTANSAALAGGAVCNWSSSPALNDCTFEADAANSGGGMCNWSSSPVLTDCRFAANTAGYGGGMYSGSDCAPVLTRCTFTGNTATARGGGMAYFSSTTAPVLTNCVFTDNSASSRGGGLAGFAAPAVLTNCTFTGNHAQDGGVIYSEALPSETLLNCTITGNSADNRGGGVYSDSSSPTLTNCIVWGNVAPDGPDLYHWVRMARATYSCLGQSYEGTGNVAADPLFVDAAQPAGADGVLGTADDGLRLRPGSPCIDAANGDVAPAEDMLGWPRYDDRGTRNRGTGTPKYADMGAYEFAGSTHKLGQRIAFEPLPERRLGDAPFVLVATAISGLPVSFAVSDPAVARLSGSTVTPRGVGVCTITASQAGDDSWDPAPTVTRTLVVQPYASLGDVVAAIDTVAAAGGRGLWDFTGSYTVPLAGAKDREGSLTLALVHDPAGKVGGLGHYAFADGTGLELVAKGSVKGQSGIVTLKLAAVGKGPTAVLKVALALSLNAVAARLEGTAVVKGKGPSGAVSFTSPVSVAVPAPMDGSWSLAFVGLTTDPRGAVFGGASLRLANGVAVPLVASGTAAGGGVHLGLTGDPSEPGAKAVKLAASLVTGGAGGVELAAFGGRLYGQALRW
jgi:hypothetical protein